jgi:CRP-like cAMP-binding protein
MIVRQFERDDDLIFILEGDARIKSFSGETVAEIGPGSVIGEVALIDSQPRSATVTSIGSTKIARIPGATVRNLMSKDAVVRATLTENIAKVLCRRLRAVNVQLDFALPKTDGELSGSR